MSGKHGHSKAIAQRLGRDNNQSGPRLHRGEMGWTGLGQLIYFLLMKQGHAKNRKKKEENLEIWTTMALFSLRIPLRCSDMIGALAWVSDCLCEDRLLTWTCVSRSVEPTGL